MCSFLLFPPGRFEADSVEVNGAWWESGAQPSATKAIIAGFFKLMDRSLLHSKGTVVNDNEIFNCCNVGFHIRGHCD